MPPVFRLPLAELSSPGVESRAVEQIVPVPQADSIGGIADAGVHAGLEGRRPIAGIYRHLKFRVDYSGHGDPNVITAPFAIPVIADREVLVGRPANVQLPAALNAPGGVTYSLSPALPSGLTFNSLTRTITGTPVATAELTE